MITITEFITARLDEDERGVTEYMRGFPIPGRGDSSVAQAARRCTMVRAMMRHAEKAGAMDRMIDGEWGPGALDEIEDAIYRDIAAYWNTHPEYRSEWARTPDSHEEA